MYDEISEYPDTTFNGELVAYALSERMTKNLVMLELFRGVSAKRPAKGLNLYSDRGSKYCAYDYQKLLEQFGMTASLGRKVDCWDNAPMESFWGTLKNDLGSSSGLPHPSAGNAGDHRVQRDLL